LNERPPNRPVLNANLDDEGLRIGFNNRKKENLAKIKDLDDRNLDEQLANLKSTVGVSTRNKPGGYDHAKETETYNDFLDKYDRNDKQ
jgi:hypothetical protein